MKTSVIKLPFLAIANFLFSTTILEMTSFPQKMPRNYKYGINVKKGEHLKLNISWEEVIQKWEYDSFHAECYSTKWIQIILRKNLTKMLVAYSFRALKRLKKELRWLNDSIELTEKEELIERLLRAKMRYKNAYKQLKIAYKKMIAEMDETPTTPTTPTTPLAEMFPTIHELPTENRFDLLSDS